MQGAERRIVQKKEGQRRQGMQMEPCRTSSLNYSTEGEEVCGCAYEREKTKNWAKTDREHRVHDAGGKFASEGPTIR